MKPILKAYDKRRGLIATMMMRMRGMMVTMAGRTQLDEHFGRDYSKQAG